MNKFLFFVFISFLLFSCQKEEDVVIPSGGNTVLVYMVAQNSLKSFAVDDMEEMIEGMKDVAENNNLIVYVDDAAAPRLIKIEKDETGNIVRKIILNYEEQESTDPDVMYKVFQRTFTSFPSESCGVIFWSHADGWLPASSPDKTRWFGQDGNSYMDISAIETVLERAAPLVENTGRFKFVMFDACYMQSVEVAYQLRRYVDYFIGSPIEIPGPGAPYHKIMKPMFSSPCDVEGIAKAYYNYYADDASYPMRNNSGSVVWYKECGVAVSMIKSSELDSLARISRKLLPEYAVELSHFDKSKVQSFDVRYQPAYYDLGDFMHCLTNESDTDFEARLKRAVPYAQSTKTCYSSTPYPSGTYFKINSYSGVSTYIPDPNNSYDWWNKFFRTYDWYQDAGWNKTGW